MDLAVIRESSKAARVPAVSLCVHIVIILNNVNYAVSNVLPEKDQLRCIQTRSSRATQSH